jgi:hypothetical protein
LFSFIYFSKQTVNLKQKILTPLFIVVFVLFVYCFWDHTVGRRGGVGMEVVVGGAPIRGKPIDKIRIR